MFIISDFVNCANIWLLHPQCQVKDVFHKNSYSSVWIASCLPSYNGDWLCKGPGGYLADVYSDDQHFLNDLSYSNKWGVGVAKRGESRN